MACMIPFSTHYSLRSRFFFFLLFNSIFLRWLVLFVSIDEFHFGCIMIVHYPFDLWTQSEIVRFFLDEDFCIKLFFAFATRINTLIWISLACVNHRKFINFFSCVSIFQFFFFLEIHFFPCVTSFLVLMSKSSFSFFHRTESINTYIKAHRVSFTFFIASSSSYFFFIYSSSLRLFGTFFSCVLQFAYFFFQHLN